jgi:DNA-binding LytR/AlgR family response regulator
MRIPVRTSPRRILLLDTPEIYFLEGQRGDALVRTARKTRYLSARRLAEWERRLTGQGFVRIHRSYLVNLDRVREIRLRSGDPNDWEVKMDPPVNAVLPVGRSYLLKMKQQLGF